MRKKISLIGRTFGKLAVVSEAEAIRKPNGCLVRRFNCDCECGKKTIVRYSNLTAGNTVSCGCQRQDAIAIQGRANFKHGHASKRTSEYSTWVSMIARCTNPKVENWCYYGGLGVTVCEAWRLSFRSFLFDMGPKPSPAHSLDRINVALGYSKENCRWATKKEQIANRRKIAAISEFTTDELLAELHRRNCQLTTPAT